MSGRALDCLTVTAPDRPHGSRRRRRTPRLSVASELPRFGRPGSRSTLLHDPAAPAQTAPSSVAVRARERARFSVLRWVGAAGSCLTAFAGIGGGALPVVENPWQNFPFGAEMGRMMLTANALVLIGVGVLVAAWLALAPFVGASPGAARGARVSNPEMLRTFIAWVIPLLATAPLFTQDIYSYLANGSIVRQGLDPYSSGPVELLGVEHHLARSVPFIWAHSPSPYGPVALGTAAVISHITGDSIFWGVLAHRAVSVAGILAAAWAVLALAKRCGVTGPAALWLGILNPLTVLHMVGGIHNEAIMMGLLLVGLEVGLRGIDRLELDRRSGWALLAASAALISCAGMVKVIGFLALGFTGMALARHLRTRPQRQRSGPRAIATSAALHAAMLVATAIAVSLVSGIGLGWVTGQGGAAQIRSWLSLTTDIGVAGGFLGMNLGLGDHTDAMLSVTRWAGLSVAAAFAVRMLWATYRGTIHPVGGLGVSTFVLVVLFPVVHPWYPLWAVLPLAAWANRFAFRASVAGYSALVSFLVLPRGLKLQAGAVATIYVSAIVGFVLLAVCVALTLRVWRRRRSTLISHE